MVREQTSWEERDYAFWVQRILYRKLGEWNLCRGWAVDQSSSSPHMFEARNSAQRELYNLLQALHTFLQLVTKDRSAASDVREDLRIGNLI